VNIIKITTIKQGNFISSLVNYSHIHTKYDLFRSAVVYKEKHFTFFCRVVEQYRTEININKIRKKIELMYLLRNNCTGHSQCLVKFRYFEGKY
jgi:hypothetical protein